MYMPLRGCQQSVNYLVAGVQTCHLDHYISCSGGNVHEKFHSCTVDVQSAKGFSTISKLPCCRFSNLPLGPLQLMRCRLCTQQVSGLYSWCTGRYGLSTISQLPCCRCTNLPLGPLQLMRCRLCTQQVSGLYSWCTGRNGVLYNQFLTLLSVYKLATGTITLAE